MDLVKSDRRSVLQGHVYMHLVESALFNKGKTKIYAGVPGILVAFACKLSFQRGHDDHVTFISESQLVQHYIDTLGVMFFTNNGAKYIIIKNNLFC